MTATRRRTLALVAALAGIGCGGRVPAFAPGTEPAYDQFELPQVQGECLVESQCFVHGCSTCVAKDLDRPPLGCAMPRVRGDGGFRFDGLTCDCLEAQCQWSRPAGQSPP